MKLHDHRYRNAVQRFLRNYGSADRPHMVGAPITYARVMAGIRKYDKQFDEELVRVTGCADY